MSEMTFMGRMQVAAATGNGIKLSPKATKQLYQRLSEAEQDRVETQIDVIRLERSMRAAVERKMRRKAVAWAAAAGVVGLALGLLV